MASGIVLGKFSVTVEKSGRGEREVLAADNSSSYAAGGSPDGVLANLTTDKQVKMPRNNSIMIVGGDKIHLYVMLSTADGMDASDSVVSIPYTEDGAYKALTTASFGFTTDFPAASPANQWLECGTGYTVPTNVKQAFIGGGDCVVSLQNDA